MVTDSIEYLKGRGLEVLFDAEHFFDGYKRNPEFSLRVLEGAVQVGADRLVLCDTNGGALPHEVEQHRRRGRGLPRRRRRRSACTCTTTPAAAWRTRSPACAAARRRCRARSTATASAPGNCNLTTIIPNLSVKMGVETLPPGRLERLTPVAHHVAELVNMALNPQAAYVGTSAFAHKAGPARQRDRQASRRVRARRAGLRRQRHPVRDVGDGGQVDHRAQGPGARASSSTARRSTRSSTR